MLHMYTCSLANFLAGTEMILAQICIFLDACLEVVFLLSVALVCDSSPAFDLDQF